MRLPVSPRHVLLVFLTVQACLLLIHPGLLPVWGDEVGTLRISSLPLERIPETLRQDYHPPLYYALVHFWLELPLPGSPIERARVLSALLLLLATLAIDRLWLRNLDRAVRMWFLALWTLSPCLLLYGRMARPYTLQVLLGCVTVYAARQFLDAPQSRRRGGAFALGALALLYTHYAPGLAVVGGVNLAFLWLAARRRAWSMLPAIAAADLLIVAGYLPWIRHMLWSVNMTTQFTAYTPSANPLLEHVIKFAYWFVSFTFGETFPLWVVAAGALTGPVLLLVIWRSVSKPPEWLVVVVPVAAIAYYGVGRWVSFAFVPARLLFLLPFYLMLLVAGTRLARRTGTAACLVILAASVASIHSYFRQDNFLNKGYIVPDNEIAAIILPRLPTEGALLIVDAYNTNVHPVLRRMPGNVRLVFVGDDDWRQKLAARMAEPQAATVWYIRNTHDVSPGREATKLEAELAAGRDVQPFQFVRYSTLDRWTMRLLGWSDLPSHMLRATEMRHK